MLGKMKRGMAGVVLALVGLAAVARALDVADVTREWTPEGKQISAERVKLPAHDEMVRIPAGEATFGAPGYDFGWDNELPEMRVAVDAFSIDRHDVTNGDYLEFVNATNRNPRNRGGVGR